MKSLTPTKLLGLMVLLLSLASGSLYAQAARNQAANSPAAAQSQPMSQNPADQTPAAEQPQTFTGKIVKAKGSFVLRDEATNAEYKLDNKDQAKQFEGKSVTVTGTLDSATNTIHVSNIEKPKS
jgi:lipopolysaccharide export system protein LptA